VNITVVVVNYFFINYLRKNAVVTGDCVETGRNFVGMQLSGFDSILLGEVVRLGKDARCNDYAEVECEPLLMCVCWMTHLSDQVGRWVGV